MYTAKKGPVIWVQRKILEKITFMCLSGNSQNVYASEKSRFLLNVRYRKRKAFSEEEFVLYY